MEPRWMAVVHRVVARGGTLSHTLRVFSIALVQMSLQDQLKGFSHVCNYARAVNQGRFQDFLNGVAQEGTMKTAERGGRAHKTKMLGQ